LDLSGAPKFLEKFNNFEGKHSLGLLSVVNTYVKGSRMPHHHRKKQHKKKTHHTMPTPKDTSSPSLPEIVLTSDGFKINDMNVSLTSMTPPLRARLMLALSYYFTLLSYAQGEEFVTSYRSDFSGAPILKLETNTQSYFYGNSYFQGKIEACLPLLWDQINSTISFALFQIIKQSASGVGGSEMDAVKIWWQADVPQNTTIERCVLDAYSLSGNNKEGIAATLLLIPAGMLLAGLTCLSFQGIKKCAQTSWPLAQSWGNFFKSKLSSKPEELKPLNEEPAVNYSV
jgi:hypothetical protein